MFRASWLFLPRRRSNVGLSSFGFYFCARRRCVVTRAAARSLLVQKPGWAVFASRPPQQLGVGSLRSSGRATVSGNEEVAAVQGGKQQKTAAALFI